MSIIGSVIAGILGPVVIWQLVVWSFERQDKRRQFRAAAEYCRQTKRQLLIAGGPWGARPFRRRLKIPAHPAGDVCLDILPNAVEGLPNAVVGTVTQLPFPDKTFGAAFASHLLEHLPDAAACKQAVKELNRVAEKVFLVSPSRQSLVAWAIPDHYLWVWQKGKKMYIKERNNDHREDTVEIA